MSCNRCDVIISCDVKLKWHRRVTEKGECVCVCVGGGGGGERWAWNTDSWREGKKGWGGGGPWKRKKASSSKRPRGRMGKREYPIEKTHTQKTTLLVGCSEIPVINDINLDESITAIKAQKNKTTTKNKNTHQQTKQKQKTERERESNTRTHTLSHIHTQRRPFVWNLLHGNTPPNKINKLTELSPLTVGTKITACTCERRFLDRKINWCRIFHSEGMYKRAPYRISATSVSHKLSWAERHLTALPIITILPRRHRSKFLFFAPPLSPHIVTFRMTGYTVLNVHRKHPAY